MRKTYKLAASLSTVFLLSACSSNGDTSSTSSSSSTNDGSGDQVVHYTAPTELSTMDTALITDINSSNYLGHVIEGLLRIDEEGNPVPAIAADEKSSRKMVLRILINFAKMRYGLMAILLQPMISYMLCKN